MPSDSDELLAWPEIVTKIRARTPARLIVGRSGAAYRTGTQLELRAAHANARGWTVGQSFVIRHCRVGILNEIGELLRPRVAILLIGERPGLATAVSLSAYLAYCPLAAHTDADRNLISNIHDRGVKADAA